MSQATKKIHSQKTKRGQNIKESRQDIQREGKTLHTDKRLGNINNINLVCSNQN